RCRVALVLRQATHRQPLVHERLNSRHHRRGERGALDQVHWRAEIRRARVVLGAYHRGRAAVVGTSEQGHVGHVAHTVRGGAVDLLLPRRLDVGDVPDVALFAGSYNGSTATVV